MYSCWRYFLKVCLGIFLVSTVIKAREKNACSMKLCKCFKQNLGVRCINLNLTYFPVLPKTIKFLKFEGNLMPNITQSILFNLTQLPLESLYMQNNGIRHIDKNFFQILGKIKVLDLSYNELTKESLYSLFTTNIHSSLTDLYLKGMGITDIPSDICKDYKSNHFLGLDLSFNRLTTLNMSVFRQITYFKKIRADFNMIKSIVLEENIYMHRISLIGNKLRVLPNFCPGIKIYPTLVSLYISNNSIIDLQPRYIHCMKRLISIDLSMNYIPRVHPGSFQELPRLSLLNLSSQRNQLKFHIASRAFNNSNLSKLFLNKNILTLSDIEQGAFDGCNGLRFLEMQNNKFFLNEDKLNGLLYPLTSLRRLNLYNTQIKTVPTVIGLRLNKLEDLVLAVNQITYWPSDLFVNLTKLSNLYVAKNRIQKVTIEMFPNYLQKRLKSISITNNPFVCECDLVWFIQWIHSDPGKFSNHRKINCINITERICLQNSIAYKSTASVICVLLLILVVVSFVYKNWWNIKYYIYMVRYRPLLQKGIADKQFIYDLFVSYCVSDEYWVLDKLLPIMEDDEQLRLCVHQRDFEGGKMIIDNIIHHMENSRKVLVVLSNDFAQSEWCLFEVSLAQKLVLDLNIESLVVVLLEDIAVANMNKSMHALLQTTTYIKWDDDQDELVLWTRLKTSVNQ